MSELYGIPEAVDSALELYAATHQATSEELMEARRDFWRFYVAAMAARLKGIRWNFNGCILCDEKVPTTPFRAQRILLVHPKVVAATSGRALGTIVCKLHSGMVSGSGHVVIEAALRLIRNEPPREDA